MKTIFMKIALVAATVFCSNFAHAKTNRIQAERVIFRYEMTKSENNHQIISMIALQNSGNLRAHHIGAKFFNPLYKVPTSNDLYNSIKSHPFFIGRLAKEPNHEEYVSLKNKISHPFFIFETRLKGKSDFYMVHSKGVRHFEINVQSDRQDNLASIDNSCKDYPDMKSFIRCTLNSLA